MLPTDLPDTRAEALLAAATLARYERHVRRLAATWLDMDLYRIVSAEVDAIGRHCTRLPDMSPAWVSLLTSHADLMHALLRGGGPARDADSAAAFLALDEHLACIDALARRCLRCVELSRRLPTDAPSSCY